MANNKKADSKGRACLTTMSTGDETVDLCESPRVWHYKMFGTCYGPTTLLNYSDGTLC